MQLNRTKGTYFTLKLVQKGIFFSDFEWMSLPYLPGAMVYGSYAS